jgi:carbon storage regulator
MLVLTRRLNEWISIGDRITVKVLSIRGDQVQIGIDAPREVPVHRGEIREQILQEMEAARRSASDPRALQRLLTRQKK